MRDLIFPVFLIVFGALVLVFLFGAGALDMAARIEYAEGVFPWLKKWTGNQKWQRILLVCTMLFYGGTLYELLKEPTPAPICAPSPKETAVTDITQENLELRRELAPLTSLEPQTSLRRQIWRLADEIQQFWIVARKDAPAPGEENQQQKMQKWINSAGLECNDKFKDRILGLVQQLEAKGVNTKVHGWLDYSVILVQNQRCLQGDEWEAFRDLGYRVDARDHKIEIQF